MMSLATEFVAYFNFAQPSYRVFHQTSFLRVIETSAEDTATMLFNEDASVCGSGLLERGATLQPLGRPLPGSPFCGSGVGVRCVANRALSVTV